MTNKISVTGEIVQEDIATKIYPFDKYEIEIRLSSSGKFLGISTIKINTDFLSYAQKVNSITHHDVEKYYEEE